jgi:four helix bundle protein
MFPFRKLSVWQRAHQLTLQVHEVTERVYRGRYASLISQMRRSSMSIAANIAEGSGQVTPAQFARYLTIAIGSARELDYHLLLGKDLGVLPLSDYARLDARINQVSGMLAKLRLRVLQRLGEKQPEPARSDQARAVVAHRPSPIRHPVRRLQHPLSD